MKYDDICSVVSQRAAIDRAAADRTVKAVLAVLAGQTDPHTFDALRGQLPREFAKTPVPEEHGSGRALDEFLTEVGALADLPTPQTRRVVLAVFAALAVAAEAFTAAVQTLGEEYAPLLPPSAELRDPAVFLATVADRAGTHTSDAEAATCATLDALAERIGADKAADVAVYLPETLRPHLVTASRQARPFDYAEFLTRISAQRQPAETYAAAVLTTVREATPEPEIQTPWRSYPTTWPACSGDRKGT